MKLFAYIDELMGRHKRLVVGLTVLVFFFSVLSFSPLRLNTDSIRLFLMALPAACGGAYGIDQFPPFYPHLLCLLMKCGWCNSVVLYGLNFLALGVGLLLVYKINRRCGLSLPLNLSVVASVLMNWNIAKHAVLPQTDILLLPFFWGTVYALLRYRDASILWHKALWILASTALACVAVSVRIAAVALFGLIAVALSGLTLKNLGKIVRRKSFWLVSGISIAVIVVGVWCAIRYTEFAADGGYFSNFQGFISQCGVGAILSMVYAHLLDLTQLVLNVPARLLPGVMGGVAVVGVTLFLLVAMWTLLRRNELDWYVFVIVMGYGLEIFLWPFLAPRFFLPILPFVLLIVFTMIGRLMHNHKKIISGLMGAYVLLGVLAWGKLIYDWSLGPDFHRHTSAPRLALAYKNATKDLVSVPQNERSIPLFILKKFDLRYRQENLNLRDYTVYKAEYAD